MKYLDLQAPISLKLNMSSDKFRESVKYKLYRNLLEADSERYNSSPRKEQVSKVIVE